MGVAWRIEPDVGEEARDACNWVRRMRERTDPRRAGLLFFLIVLCILTMALFRRGDAGFMQKHGDIGTIDFIQYWSAHKLLLSGQNPYNPSLLYRVELEEGLSDRDPIMMWNPPWLVTLLTPVLSFNFLTSSAIWFTTNLVFITLTGLLVQAAYMERLQRDPLVLVAMSLFMPHFSALYYGQLGLFFALCVGVFLLGARKCNSAVMGLSLVPFTVKPHLFYLVVIYLAYWIYRERRWRIVLWFAFGFGLLLLATAVQFPHAIQEWLAALKHPPTQWVVPTLVGILRYTFFRLTGEVPAWPLFVVPGCAAFGLVAWLSTRRSAPNLLCELPAVLALSLFSAPYGWLHDQALLVVVPVGLIALCEPVLVTQRTRPVVFGILMLIQVLAMAQTVLGLRHHHNYFWMSIALGGIWVLGVRKIKMEYGAGPQAEHLSLRD
jgi:hypothetical protein